MTLSLVDTTTSNDVLARLGTVSSVRGVHATARLGSLLGCIDDDMRHIEGALEDLGATSRIDAGTPVHGTVRHLLEHKGKRLRPMCVALGSRIGSGLGPNGRELMIAAELVHNATLLHDDVVDLGDVRRGAQTARVIYGNAASIFAGDWLLVEALRRIQASRVPGVLEQVLSVLAQMLAAESLQLACRGSVTADMGTYMRIVEGKTASLFRWALFAGARAGNVSDDACRALEAYGDKLGVAFQIVDDLLDIAGDAAITGKSLLMDLREGKTTYPLILAMEKNAGLGALVSEACATTDANVESALHERIVAAVRACGAVEETKKFARKLSEDATSFLAAVPPCTARDALECIAVELVSRTR